MNVKTHARNLNRNKRSFRGGAAQSTMIKATNLHRRCCWSLSTSKLQQDVHQLNQMLIREKDQCYREKMARMVQSKDLDITKKQLKKERQLKMTFINRCKYLEGLLGDSTGENYLMHLGSPDKIKQTSNGFEATQEDPTTSNKVLADLKAEVNKNKLLQEELDKVKAAHNEMGVRYKDDMLSAMQMMKTLKCEIQLQMEVHADLVQDHADLTSLTLDNTICQEMLEENKGLHAEIQSTRQQIETLQHELQKIQTHSDNVSHYKDALAALTVEHNAICQEMVEVKQSYENDMISARQMVEALQLELQEHRQTQADKVSRDQSVIMALKAEHHATCQKMAQEMADLQKSALQEKQMMVKELERVNTKLNAQKDYEELKELKTTGVGVFRAAILEERNKVSQLLEYLERYEAKHQELNDKYTSEVLSFRQQAENQKQKFETEIQSYSDKLTQSQKHISHLRAEQDALRLRVELSAAPT
ncbi:GRIP and coiled-coil domain-containing protein 2-like isoform X5 [Notolabrus celidotus]|uniref:GRIP and coiled-coil domain-containing protein 2-like isoform X4 n=1 Tax=Notolabrus celidotus TaxID=1203425 RepID=UPI00148F6D38|nr:GRIP and coiled-coil domain-containing protein 2-like isoform X4 [Notolabrus celidotus]XP_034559465.1 GRIP and coiled-coil domain-containing protein 2-like isoform X5 [Notolabrus celidotus]